MQKLIATLLIVSVTLLGGNVLLQVAGSSGMNLMHEAFTASEAALLELSVNGWARTDECPRW